MQAILRLVEIDRKDLLLCQFASSTTSISCFLVKQIVHG